MRGPWLVRALALLPMAFLGCFRHSSVDPTTLKCATDENCPTGYVCAGASTGVLGTCARSRGGAHDAGFSDAAGNPSDSGTGSVAAEGGVVDLSAGSNDAPTIGSGGASGSGGSTTPSAGGGAPASGGVLSTGGVSSRTGGSTAGGPTGGSGGSGRGGASAGGGGGRTGGLGTGGTGPGMGGASAGTGGTSVGTGGARTGGAGAISSGGAGSGGASADGGGAAPGKDCTMGTWPAADPARPGPFITVIENPVGPTAGTPSDGGAPPQFTVFRPQDLAQTGLCHPLITWGSGTNASPTMYKGLLGNLASHGFVVIGSNSPNVAQGNPAPMIVGVTWVLEQNDDPTSALYHRIDTTHIGATGHSQGAMATSTAAGDSHIVTSVPIEGAQVQKNLHGPAMFFCGGLDTIVGCSGAQSAINAVTTLPAMYAEYLSVDHGSWMSAAGNKPSVVETAVIAWMRVHLMGDTDLRSWFYGTSCKLCTDSGWNIVQKNMDQ